MAAARVLAPPRALGVKVTVCAECGSVLFDGVGHDELCSRTGTGVRYRALPPRQRVGVPALVLAVLAGVC